MPGTLRRLPASAATAGASISAAIALAVVALVALTTVRNLNMSHVMLWMGRQCERERKGGGKGERGIAGR